MPRNIPKSVAIPRSLAEVEAILVDDEVHDILYLAGGTDLVLDANERRLPPCDVLIYLDRIPELKEIERRGDMLLIGSCVTHEELAASPMIRELFPMLAQAADGVGSPPIRTMGTIGGNLARSSPAGDVATSVQALDAVIVTIGRNGGRRIFCHEFHVAPRKSVLENGELIVRIEVPIPHGLTGSAFEKIGGRKTMFIASVSCGAFLVLDPETGRITDARLCQGSIAPTPVRVPAAEQLLIGQLPGEALFELAAEAAREQAHPRTSHRGTAQYRREMAGALTLRCLRRALETASKEDEKK